TRPGRPWYTDHPAEALLPGRRAVPDQHGPVVPGAGQALAVPAEGDGPDSAFVSLFRLRTSWPDGQSHTLTVWSMLAVASRLPSQLKARPGSHRSLTGMERASRPVPASHARTVPSQEAVTRCLPSGLKATERKGVTFAWKVWMIRPVAAWSTSAFARTES